MSVSTHSMDNRAADREPRPLKVHLLGGEGVGWALDQDVDNTRLALQQLAGQIELVDAEAADVFHAVWDQPLDRLAPDAIAGRHVVCHVCTNFYKMLEQAASVRRRDRVSLWVTQTAEASEAARQLSWPHHYVPYACDIAALSKPTIPVTRGELGIPSDRFLIGNFMRDSLGSNLDAPKPEKGADIFLELVSGLKSRGVPVHVLLAGPRRHWLRRRLAERGVPFTFVGQVVPGDDIGVNILPSQRIAALYHVLDLCLVTSRHEGGPRAVLEAAAARIPMVSTPVGLARDVLHESCLYRAIDEGVDKVCDIALKGYAPGLLDQHYRTVSERHSVDFVARRFAELYQALPSISRPVAGRPVSSGVPLSAAPSAGCRQGFRRVLGFLRRRPLPGLGVKISLWHQFFKPPYGGGNQFMMALQKGLHSLGVEVVNNSLDDSVDVHICNAVWFDPQLVDKLTGGVRGRVIHRLDGLVHVARGQPDRSIDDRAYEFNHRLAAATVMQSQWCLNQALRMGYAPARPVLIRNASNPAIFFPPSRRKEGSRLRLIATSWSDNPMKGFAFYKALEKKLDWSKFEFTFVGRTQEVFERIRVLPPMASGQLSDVLRQHDIYITASRNEACSNALIEALSCGLPALYLNDSSNSELVGHGGLPFESEDDMLPQLVRLAESRAAFRQCIRVETLNSVAMRYLELAQEVMRN